MFHRATYKHLWRNGHDPKDHKSRRKRVSKRACVSGTSLRAKWVQFLQNLRLSSRRTCCSAPEGRILSECARVCTYTHRHTQSELFPQWIYLYHSSFIYGSEGIVKEGPQRRQEESNCQRVCCETVSSAKMKPEQRQYQWTYRCGRGRFHRVPLLNKEPEKWLLGEGGFAYVGEHRVGGGFNQVILYAFMRIYIIIKIALKSTSVRWWLSLSGRWKRKVKNLMSRMILDLI